MLIHVCYSFHVSYPSTAKSDIYITPNQRLIVAKRGRNIEAYQIDSRQLELSIPTEEGYISCSSISDGHFIFALQQKIGE